MHCGILTLHNALNYGAFLQAFALKKTIEEEIGCEANVVSLAKNRWLERLLLVKCKYPKRVIHHCRFLREMDKARHLLDIRRDGLERYDVIVVGSDELWNLENNSFIHRPEYFGRGIAGKRIISYAVSANAVTLEKFRKLTKGCEDFSRFDCISVRDLNTLRVVNSAGRKDAAVVIDPTLLLHDWTRFAVPCQKKDFISSKNSNDINKYAVAGGLLLYLFHAIMVRRWGENKIGLKKAVFFIESFYLRFSVRMCQILKRLFFT